VNIRLPAAWQKIWNLAGKSPSFSVDTLDMIVGIMYN
jgi:hypothetical protein